jgi:hypothetical protein
VWRAVATSSVHSDLLCSRSLGWEPSFCLPDTPMRIDLQNPGLVHNDALQSPPSSQVCSIFPQITFTHLCCLLAPASVSDASHPSREFRSLLPPLPGQFESNYCSSRTCRQRESLWLNARAFSAHADNVSDTIAHETGPLSMFVIRHETDGVKHLLLPGSRHHRSC